MAKELGDGQVDEDSTILLTSLTDLNFTTALFCSSTSTASSGTSRPPNRSPLPSTASLLPSPPTSDLCPSHPTPSPTHTGRLSDEVLVRGGAEPHPPSPREEGGRGRARSSTPTLEGQ